MFGVQKVFWFEKYFELKKKNLGDEFFDTIYYLVGKITWLEKILKWREWVKKENKNAFLNWNFI